MSDTHTQTERRLFLTAIAALPAGLVAAQQKSPPATAGVRVAAGNGRFNQILRLPGGGQLFIKVSAQDTAGAFLLTEQPSAGKGGPPKHYHRDEDEWFYCLQGQYVVEVGSQRFELNAGDSVLGPRRVPHAFAFVGDTPGRLLVGFTPAGRMEQFFRDLSARGQYFGVGTDADRQRAEKEYGVINVGPPLTV
jgi:quercetin dioxygenase-like cupin family protein